MEKTNKALLTSAVRHISSRRNNVTSSRQRQRVKIVEVSARDGLQNEPDAIVDIATKASLIARLAQAGLTSIEAGSFVSPKVKQMANTREVLLHENLRPVLRDGRTTLSVLVPNLRGLQDFLDTAKALKAHGVDTSSLEIAIFASATEGFSRANLNVSRAEALDQLGRVAQLAIDEGIKVRGYVSCVVKCPYDGITEPREVASTTRALLDMGCYEVSLGDTIGAGTVSTLEDMLSAVTATSSLSKLAIHCHDTNGLAVPSVLHLVQLGMSTVDSSIAGLGGCPYAPGAKGNVATEDVVYTLEKNGFDTGLIKTSGQALVFSEEYELAFATKMAELSRIGTWISESMGRESASKIAGRFM